MSEIYSKQFIVELTQENEQLKAEVEKLKLQLQSYIDQEIREAKEADLHDRILFLVKVCFPTYNARQPEKDKPIRHPEKAWWWNGAVVKGYVVLDNGDVEVEVESYVGDGETDEGIIYLHKKWFEIENPTEVVQQWCVKETIRREQQKQESKICETKNEIKRLQKIIDNEESFITEGGPT